VATYTVKMQATDDQTGEVVFEVSPSGLAQDDPVFQAAGQLYAAEAAKIVKSGDLPASVPFAGA
jgi:hypothetical protein